MYYYLKINKNDQQFTNYRMSITTTKYAHMSRRGSRATYVGISKVAIKDSEFL